MEYRWHRHRMRFQRMNRPRRRRFRRRYRRRQGCLVLPRHHHRAIPSSFPCWVRKRSSSRSCIVSAVWDSTGVHVQGSTVRVATYTRVGVSTVRGSGYPLGSIPDLAISSACSLSGVRAGHTRNDHHHRKPFQSLLYPHPQHFR